MIRFRVGYIPAHDHVYNPSADVLIIVCDEWYGRGYVFLLMFL